MKSADDGRDTFKALIRQGISGESSALLFLEWAALERDRGSGESKSASILQKGLREGAQPPHLLEAAAAELAMGNWKPVALHLQPPANSIPALSAANQTASLSCSGSTIFPPMVTPALETERPMRTHATLTLVRGHVLIPVDAFCWSKLNNELQVFRLLLVACLRHNSY